MVNFHQSLRFNAFLEILAKFRFIFKGINSILKQICNELKGVNSVLKRIEANLTKQIIKESEFRSERETNLKRSFETILKQIRSEFERKLTYKKEIFKTIYSEI